MADTQNTGPNRTSVLPLDSAQTQPPTEAVSKLTDAVDEFIQDIEHKFKNISDEILTKLDDMAERCDRLEQDMLARDLGSNTTRNSTDTAEGLGIRS